ncbi:MAG: adenosine kinase [Paludibacteraceae bacterium]
MKKILGMGNALVDILMRLKSDDLLQRLELPKGSMQLIDEDKMRAIQEATILLDQHVATGGSASNTISGLARLGVDVGFIGKVGSDSIGDFFKVDSFENGVLTYLLGSQLPSGRCHVLISPDSERTMCTYLGAASDLRAADLSADMLRDFNLLHIEGYMVESHELMLRAAKLAHNAGMQVSLDLASYNVVEAHKDFLRDYAKRYVDIVFANEDEAFAFTGKHDEEAAHEIAQLCSIAIVKVGKRGSFAVSGDTVFRIPAAKVNCIDTTGAGDLYAAGFLYGYARGLSLDKCAKIGTICAGHVITFVGAKMDDRTWKSINAIVGNF